MSETDDRMARIAADLMPLTIERLKEVNGRLSATVVAQKAEIEQLRERLTQALDG